MKLLRVNVAEASMLASRAEIIVMSRHDFNFL